MNYVQLLNGDTELINMKGLSQSIKMKYKPEEHHMEKILNGDKSDNIPPCGFNTGEEYVKDCKQNRTLIDFDSIPANTSNEI
jgi:hypothetical protein